MAERKTPDEVSGSRARSAGRGCRLSAGRRETPAGAAATGARTQQVNVRLAADEKALLESTARRKGYSGMSDFLRAAALDAAN